ncbi:UvrD-helicase domain-containing protein [Streptomyces sp. NPDC001581]|uniref:UvrD-helicase domain-containing protein n=1 Tax=Streptomyces sp. NPDC001581 TaxID=3154386 RepID=UPI00331D4055
MELPLTPDALSKEKVDAAAVGLGLTLPHQEQWDFLQSLYTLDLQAAPGSGKTSLIGLKLALLAQGWTSTTRGVCVLSHTNTAKDEVRDRIAATLAGRGLLRYPHFIGTIQSFAHTFLAAPAIRSQGGRVLVVDDDAYAAAAQRILHGSWDYAKLRTTLEHQTDGQRLLSDASYVCDGAELKVASFRPLPFGEVSDSGKQFAALKHRIAWSGIFRFADMYAIAERHLARAPALARAVAGRFPFALLDEMQDTDAVQHRLLDKVFGAGGTVVQRVGDVNQRIFSGSPNEGVSASSFPLPMAGELPVSRRFGSRIAGLAGQLTVQRRQEIVGAGPEGTVALLLFDEESVQEVVPAFERLAASTVPEELLAAIPPRVLGARKQRGAAQQYPQSLACYIPGFGAAEEETTAMRGLLVPIVRAARARWATGHGHAAAVDLWNGIRASTCPTHSRAASPLPALSRLDRSPATAGGRTRAVLLDLLTESVEETRGWIALTSRLAASLRDLADGAVLNLSCLDGFLEPVGPQTGLPARQGTAVVGTIQSAKGETHAATLILDCLGRTGKKYDVGQAIAFLAGDGDLLRASATVKQAMQLIFVGATRPSHLLAFATQRERASPHLAALEDRGWLIHDVAEPQQGKRPYG